VALLVAFAADGSAATDQGGQQEGGPHGDRRRLRRGGGTQRQPRAHAPVHRSIAYLTLLFAVIAITSLLPWGSW
jgi:hypothetical protein